MLAIYSKLRQNVNMVNKDRAGRLGIGRLAELTGIDPATIRTWENRYGVPTPERTSGGQRRYSQQEVERIRAMQRLLEAGYRTSEAARVVSSTWGEGPRSVLPDSRDDIASLLTEGELSALGMLDRLAAAVPLEDVINDFVAPVMREIGVRWERGNLSVAEEHAASALVGSWLGGQMRTLPPPLRPGLVVLATPEGERHELGLVMLALFLRRQGVQVLHLGSDLPIEDVVKIAGRREPGVVVLSASTEQALPGLSKAIPVLKRALGKVPIAVGGSFFADRKAPEGTVLLPNEFVAATAAILEFAA